MVDAQVTKLMGHEPLTKWVVLGVVSLQVAMAYCLRNTSMVSPIFLVLAYVIGATANQNLFLAIHEITHNLAFKGIKANKALAMFANLPIGIPYCSAFKVSLVPRSLQLGLTPIKGYHLEHHRYLGEDGIDTDLPTSLELILLNNVFGKVFFT